MVELFRSKGQKREDCRVGGTGSYPAKKENIFQLQQIPKMTTLVPHKNRETGNRFMGCMVTDWKNPGIFDENKKQVGHFMFLLLSIRVAIPQSGTTRGLTYNKANEILTPLKKSKKH
ncbi:hypothetical protein ACJJTC_007756 [Scirpophaga incertulas]